jgi:outer membrane protein assembly factor BamD
MRVLGPLCFSFLILFASCSDFAKVQNSEDINEKLEGAMKYYEKKDYYKAGLLFDQIVPLLKGKAEAEKAQFYQAYTYYQQNDYLLSSYYFREFYQTYQRSQYHEEAMFMYAKSLYKDSPEFNLDQTSTFDALSAIELFLRRYPISKSSEEAKAMYMELEAKLEKKSFENAALYARVRDYKAGVVALRNFMKTYPESVYFEEASYLIVYAQYNLAKNSIEGEIQMKRYYEVLDYYRDFIDVYPNSLHKKEAEDIYKTSSDKLAELKEKNFFSKVEAAYSIARNATVQLEQKLQFYQDALKQCDLFEKEYPDSRYKKELASIRQNCKEVIVALNKSYNQ